MRHAINCLLTGVAALVLMAGTAHATTIIDFGTGSAGDGGSLSIGSDIVGTNIPFGAFSVAGAPMNNGSWANVTGSCGGYACLNFDQNANTFSIVGALGSPINVSATTLVSGNMSGVTLVADSSTTGQVSVEASNAMAATSLLTALGLPVGSTFAGPIGVIGFSNGTGSPYTVDSTDTTLSTGTGPVGGQGGPGTVPEPGSMVLL